MTKDRTIYFYIAPTTFNFYFDGGLIAQFFDLVDAIKYIKRKHKAGYTIKDIHERGDWK